MERLDGRVKPGHEGTWQRRSAHILLDPYPDLLPIAT
jgi:hypothetical protein